MKVFKISMLAFFAAMLLISCKKDKDADPPPPPTLEGVWEGIYSFSYSPNITYAYGIEIKQGGGLDRIDPNGAVMGTGTWFESAGFFYGNYEFPSGDRFSVAAAIDSNTGRLEGTWGYNYNTADGGMISLSKKND